MLSYQLSGLKAQSLRKEYAVCALFLFILWQVEWASHFRTIFCPKDSISMIEKQQQRINK
jgi:hypothetical protein